MLTYLVQKMRQNTGSHQLCAKNINCQLLECIYKKLR